MRVFIYEAITGGGTWSSDKLRPKGCLLSEGAAMTRAVISDFAALPGAEVWGLRDARLLHLDLGPRKEHLVRSRTQERELLVQLAAEAEWTLLIAPEIDGMLQERHAWLAGTSAQLLCPEGEFLRIASSKTATAERLRERGVPTPPPVTAEEATAADFPLILKPVDGAGSTDVRLIRSRNELPPSHPTEKWRLERYCPGLAASTSLLCGPGGNTALEPCEQVFRLGTFDYVGGRMPLPPNLIRRAVKLAHAAMDAMPRTVGYVGIDMVLGPDDKGKDDVVVEINPRLTTSYVGLRAACRQNLAEAMLATARGEPAALLFGPEGVEFRADGTILTATDLTRL